MKQNLGTFDKILRISFSIIVALLYFTNQIEGTIALVLGLLSTIFLLTSLIGYCPIYGVCHISTRKNKETAR
jgi:hypothetical protein